MNHRKATKIGVVKHAVNKSAGNLGLVGKSSLAAQGARTMQSLWWLLLLLPAPPVEEEEEEEEVGGAALGGPSSPPAVPPREEEEEEDDEEDAAGMTGVWRKCGRRIPAPEQSRT